MRGYFNDIIGSITFMSYINIITEFKKVRLLKLWQIEILLLGCGVFWEYITPLFRKETVSDIWDIAAYMFGGIIYWVVNKIYEKTSRVKKLKKN